MESNFNNRDFEQFVKQNADQYRMFPSEKVWRGIHNTLHTRRRWYGIGLTFLLLTIGTVTWVMVSSPGKDQPVSINSTTPSVNIPAIAQKANTDIKSNNKTLFIPGTDSWQKDLPPATATTNTENKLEEGSNRIPGAESETLEDIAVNNKLTSGIITSAVPLFNFNKESLYPIPGEVYSIGTITDDNPEFELNKSRQTIATENKMIDIYPLSIESVINSFENITNRKKLSWQIYFAPTISYRKLAENKGFLSSSQSNNSPYSYAALYDVNSAVTHKPDMGFELGFSTGYPISKNLKIIGGVQFNVSKYDIRAYTTSTELATIALTNDNGTRSGSVSTPTNYRNFGGYRPNWLHNLYLSASAPFGAELKLKGDNKTYLGISGTIQPSYILGDRAYMISTDYKNYVEVPQLIRRWNVSTSFETFAGYSTGKLNWKIGPQVRYQLLSSFQKKYPVKEHIFDFGLKVGIMLNQ
jgi:hypothetical protein